MKRISITAFIIASALLLIGAASTTTSFFKNVSAWSYLTPTITLTPGATVTADASLGSHFRLTAAQNFTLNNPINAANSERLIFEIIQDGTGNRLITMDTKFAFGTDITGITLSTTAGKRDFLTVIYNSTTDRFYCVGFVKGY